MSLYPLGALCVCVAHFVHGALAIWARLSGGDCGSPARVVAQAAVGVCGHQRRGELCKTALLMTKATAAGRRLYIYNVSCSCFMVFLARLSGGDCANVAALLVWWHRQRCVCGHQRQGELCGKFALLVTQARTFQATAAHVVVVVVVGGGGVLS